MSGDLPTRDRHMGVLCNGCGVVDFKSRRFKCLHCEDFDLCGPCFDTGQVQPPHSAIHSMQAILTAADIELYFGGQTEGYVDQDALTWESFACPVRHCRRLGFTKIDLYTHIMDDHDEYDGRVMCPVCVVNNSMIDNSRPPLWTTDLGGHLAMEHLNGVFETSYSHFSESDNGSQSPRQPTYGYGAYFRSRSPSPPGRRSNLSPPPPNAAMAMRGGRFSCGGVGRGRPTALYMESVRFDAAGGGDFSAPSTRRTYLRGQIRLADNNSGASGDRYDPEALADTFRQQRADVNESQQTDEHFDDTGATTQGSSRASGTPSSAAGMIAAVVGGAVLEPSIGALFLDERSLIPRLLEPSNPTEEELERIDVERANRSLFVQELLMSTIFKSDQK